VRLPDIHQSQHHENEGLQGVYRAGARRALITFFQPSITFP